jgi:hypothetical protein
MRADIEAQNVVLGDLDLDVAHPDVVYHPNGLLRIRGPKGDRLLNSDDRAYGRIFNRDWEHGGRWYGPFWQQLPKSLREHIMINGEATIERDYSALHPRLLYALAGLDPRLNDEGFDPYAIDGFERQVIKWAVNILINADTLPKATGALTTRLAEMGYPSPDDSARSVIAAVKRARPELARFWASGMGHRLQAIDSDMVASVQGDMRAIGVPTLSVHDSFIVPVHANHQLAKSMIAHVERACQTIQKRLGAT